MAHTCNWNPLTPWLRILQKLYVPHEEMQTRTLGNFRRQEAHEEQPMEVDYIDYRSFRPHDPADHMEGGSQECSSTDLFDIGDESEVKLQLLDEWSVPVKFVTKVPAGGGF